MSDAYTMYIVAFMSTGANCLFVDNAKTYVTSSSGQRVYESMFPVLV